MDTLFNYLSSLNEKSSIEKVQSTFSKIAEILLNRSHIVTCYGKYQILEIEFYFCSPIHYDDVTILRDEKPGMWWLHDWGVDITFNSEEEKKYYGGILIRSLYNENNGKFIFGPRKCSWELFYSSALKPSDTPCIFIDKSETNLIGSTTRYIPGRKKGIEGNYNYFVLNIDKKVLANYKESPWNRHDQR